MTTAKRVCPKCNNPMDSRSRQCRSCMSGGIPRLYPAPKHPAALQPRHNAPVPNWELLNQDDAWIYQFVGLFHGEGSVGIHRTNKNSFVAHISLGLRIDDILVIQSIVQYLGGHISSSKAYKGSYPMKRWQIAKASEVLPLLKMIEQYTVIPAKKLNDVKVVIEFCEWRLSQPYHIADWTPAVILREKLRNIRIVKEQSNG